MSTLLPVLLPIGEIYHCIKCTVCTEIYQNSPVQNPSQFTDLSFSLLVGWGETQLREAWAKTQRVLNRRRYKLWLVVCQSWDI